MEVLRCQAPCVPVMLCDVGGSTHHLWAFGGLYIKQIQTQMTQFRHLLLQEVFHATQAGSDLPLQVGSPLLPSIWHN